MPRPNSKSRQELRSRFVRNAIPTETDFTDLIAASLNQADDGVLKLPDQPLGLVRQKPDQPVLRFFADPAAEGSVWQVQLGAGDKPGFGLAAADGKLALFVDGKTGNVGIGTVNPGNKLTVQGNFNESKDPESGISHGGLLALKGNAPQIDFIDTEHGDWSIHVNSNKMLFIRQPWEYTDLVLDGGGRVGIGTDNPLAKLHVLGDLLVNGAVVRSIWAGSGNGPTEMGDMGRLHSRTIRINKLFPETALRIVYCDNFRVYGDNVACRWEIRVDGNSVNPPILADRYESSGNRHLHGTVMGYARGVAAGAHEIQVWIVPHPHNQGRGTDTDVETGWSASTWSLEAEEVWFA